MTFSGCVSVFSSFTCWPSEFSLAVAFDRAILAFFSECIVEGAALGRLRVAVGSDLAAAGRRSLVVGLPGAVPLSEVSDGGGTASSPDESVSAVTLPMTFMAIFLPEPKLLPNLSLCKSGLNLGLPVALMSLAESCESRTRSKFSV